jgi:hypothetical protein
MDDRTKIQLSPLEMDLLNNSDWILTKNGIVKKARRLLESVQENIIDYGNQHPGIFPNEVMAIPPKISKGENYKGLPWLMLDYPRYFHKENFCAIRTMFWWGNFFSTTLHLSGKYKEMYANALIHSYNQFCDDGVYTCINTEQWHHHLEKENYLPVRHLSLPEFSDQVQKRSFIKLSQKTSFSQWDHAITLLSGNFVKIAGWLN